MPITSLFDADVTDQDQQTTPGLQLTLVPNKTELSEDEQRLLELESTDITNNWLRVLLPG